MSLAVPALPHSVFSSVHTKLQTYYHFGLSIAFPVSTWHLRYSSGLDSHIKVSSIKYLHFLCIFSGRQGKGERGRGLVGSPVSVLFPTAASTHYGREDP